MSIIIRNLPDIECDDQVKNLEFLLPAVRIRRSKVFFCLISALAIFSVSLALGSTSHCISFNMITFVFSCVLSLLHHLFILSFPRTVKLIFLF